MRSGDKESLRTCCSAIGVSGPGGGGLLLTRRPGSRAIQNKALPAPVEVRCEPLGAIFDTGSKTHAAMAAYMSAFVARYESRLSVLYWEVDRNEYNLWVDIPLKETWNVRTECGTPDKRSTEIPYTSLELRTGRHGRLRQDGASGRRGERAHCLERSHDPLQVLVPQPARRERLRRVRRRGRRLRKQDGKAEFASQLTAFSPNAAIDAMSVHIYATNGHHNVRVGYTDRWGAEVLGFIDGVARDNEQVLFLGEYGASPCPNKWTPSTPFVYASNVLDALVEHSVPLSAIWVFDCDIRCNRTHHNDLRPLPQCVARFLSCPNPSVVSIQLSSICSLTSRISFPLSLARA